MGWLQTGAIKHCDQPASAPLMPKFYNVVLAGMPVRDKENGISYKLQTFVDNPPLAVTLRSQRHTQSVSEALRAPG